MAIEGDSIEYELLIQWCEKLPFFEEPKSVTTCEIGVRKGLGSKLIINSIKKRIGNKPYEHIGIDPYNNLLYQHYDDGKEYQNDYTDEMRQEMVNDMADEKNFSFHHLTDIQFMNVFANTNKIFDLVHFDGPHMTKDIIREAVWFADKSRKGTRFIFDDYTRFKITSVKECLKAWNFEPVEAGERKICFQREY